MALNLSKKLNTCMNETKSNFENNNQAFYYLLIFVLLYLCYSSIFLTDYLMNDEMVRIFTNKSQHIESARSLFLKYGRGIYGFFRSITFSFIDHDPFKIQIVRFFHFFSLSIIAIVLFRFIQIQSKNAAFSLLVILFYFSQPSMQGVMGYSLTLFPGIQPAIWLSLLSFYLHFYYFKKKNIPVFIKNGTVFFILMLSMQSTQTYAFFSMIFVTTILLFDKNVNFKVVVNYLIICTIVFLVSGVMYKLGADYLQEIGRKGYHLGDGAISHLMSEPVQVILKALNPASYFSAFTLWNYSFPLHSVPPLGEMKKTIATAVSFVWVATVFYAIFCEYRKPETDRYNLIIRWVLILVTIGFGVLFLVSESPLEVIYHRPHMTLVLSGLVVLIGAWAILQLSGQLLALKRGTHYILVAYVIFSFFGAQSGVLRNIVGTRAAQLEFIKTELSSKSPSKYNEVVIVRPIENGCKYEPCAPAIGSVVHGKYHLSREGRYKYALASLGIENSQISFTFVKQLPKQIEENQLVIDWNKFTASKL